MHPLLKHAHTHTHASSVKYYVGHEFITVMLWNYRNYMLLASKIVQVFSELIIACWKPENFIKASSVEGSSVATLNDMLKY